MKKKTLLYLLPLLGVFLCSGEARGAVHRETVEYRHGDTVLEGFVAYEDGHQGKLPGVIIVHEWTGVGPYVMKRAEQIASLGYAAFCIDMYGKGIRPRDAGEAAKLAAFYRAGGASFTWRLQTGTTGLFLRETDRARA